MWARAAILCVACALPALGGETAQKAFLRLEVNRVDKGDTLCLLQGGDVLVKPDELSRAGLRGFDAIGPWVSLRSLAPALRFEVDEKSATLRITADPEHLEHVTLDLGHSARPADLVFSAAPSFFLNYSAQASDGGRAAAFGEAGLSIGSALATSGVSMRTGGGAVRGLSSLTWDDPAHLRRAIAGDFFAGGSALGSALLLGGVSFSRELSLDPYFVAAPREELRGAAATPSRVEIYDGDRLVRTEQLAPGPYSLFDVPAAGAQTRVVVRDAFGRAQEFTPGSYSTASLLAPGLTDFAWQAGFRRGALATDSFAYGAPALMARHRVGVTRFLTLGARGEGDLSGVSGGPTLTTATPAGTLDLALAGSAAQGKSGAAAWAAYGVSVRRLALSGEATWMSARFSNLTIAPGDDRPRVSLRLLTSTSLGPLSLSAGYLAAFLRDGGLQRRFTAAATVRIASSLSLSADATIEPGHPERLSAFAGLTFMLGTSSTTASVQGTRAAQSESLVAQRPLPVGEGVGYTVRAQNGVVPEGSVALQAQGAHGRYEASYGRAGTAQSWSASAAGALVSVGGSFFATRPVQQGFALVEVPGVEGVRAYLNNQELGRTDSRGRLLIPEVMPYYGNRFRIADQDLPLQYGIGAVERTIAGPVRGAALARFDVRRLLAFTGRAIADGAALGPQSELWLDGKPVMLGLDGRFYLENATPGAHTLLLARAGAKCAMPLRLPDSKLPIVDLGKVTCGRPEGAAHKGRLFVDANGDGVWQPGEPVLDGVKLRGPEGSTATDAEGFYELSGEPEPAGALELPAGYRMDSLPSGDLPVRKPRPLEDLGSALVLDLGAGTTRVSQVQAATIPLVRWLSSQPLTRAEDGAVQRLGTDVLDAKDLRVLVVVHPPAKPVAAAFAEALRGARAALRYLKGAAMVPASRLIWTVADSVPEAPAGSVDVLLVRMPKGGAR